ncbi:hypothetical protein FAM09_17555 [Niastella caeni]|uniref:Type VI secretion system baseplate subunit TssK n=1 Tax=Niastella caeni TaxID=2569763 RepID=A0A4S8HSK6_9BACT|nr:hypothetical protein [Niastella caeni]THU38473.1 hypothetical protein FAM09_17555 [Niastella caeni]
MQSTSEYLPVNWVDGMKINKTHFLAQDNAFTYRQAHTVSSFLNEHNYGLLPVFDRHHTSAKLFLSLDNEQTVHLRIQRCRAISRGGYVMEFDTDTSLTGQQLSAGVPGLQVPFAELKDRSEFYYVVLSIDPYKRVPFGIADPKETPPRMPFTMPVYDLTLLPAHETSALSLGQFQVPVGKVIVEEQIVRLVENYIPPCTAVNSHYELLEVHAGLEQFFGQMELYALQIIQKILQKKQQNDLADAIYKICENLSTFTATEFSNFKLSYIYQPPVFMITAVAGMARLIKNTMDYYAGTSKDELISYCTEWCGVSQGELETAITTLCNYQYNHLDINDALEKVLRFTQIISSLFGSLSRLEYIGKKKETGIFVKEQLLVPQTESVPVKKRRSFLAD